MKKTVKTVCEKLHEEKIIGDEEVFISGVTYDSRQVRSGFLFCCVPGEYMDGHSFAGQAIDSGASALLVERVLPVDVTQILVADVRASMGVVASAFYGNPAKDLTVVGVTGTNGKSSIVQMLFDIWEEAGIKSEVIGTLQGARTTPEAPDLQEQLYQAVQSGTEAIAMEVSSHALELHRVAGVTFDLAIFTNLSHDHLDFHKDMESYFQAKAKLFSPERSAKSVVNIDDLYGKRLKDQYADVYSFSMEDAKELVFDGPSSKFCWRDHQISLSLAGSHNVSNALGAASAASLLGIDSQSIANALSNASPVHGRFEIVSEGLPFWVAVDYAHTPDALETVLASAKEAATSDRVVVVFGCGGDRDSLKRPLMGKAAEKGSDLTILTTDNPRSENPATIVNDVLSGCEQPQDVVCIADRKEAIQKAIFGAAPGDIVVIAGKGHESGQIVGNVTHPFNDVVIAKEILGELS